MSALTAALYGLCLLFLAAAALLIFAKDPHSRLHRHFALLLLALLGWVASLFVFGLPLGLRLAPELLLWLGRFNFACLVPAVLLSFLFVQDISTRRFVQDISTRRFVQDISTRRFVQDIAGRHRQERTPITTWLWLETALLFLLTLLTPLVDQAELILAGQHITLYGPLFALYALHLVALLAAMLWAAFRPVAGASLETRSQLRLTGIGALATAAIALTTNALLPYVFGNFHLIHVGTLSTIFFLFAVADAVFVHHLFDIRLVIRAAFVYAGLIALTLELYQLALSFLIRLVPVGDQAQSHLAATAMVLVINAFTQQPVRRWLEGRIDHSLRPKPSAPRQHLHQPLSAATQSTSSQNASSKIRAVREAHPVRPAGASKS